MLFSETKRKMNEGDSLLEAQPNAQAPTPSQHPLLACAVVRTSSAAGVGGVVQPHLVVDPKTRDRLGLNSASATGHNQSATQSSQTNSFLNPLAVPALNSSNLVTRKLRVVQNLKPQPVIPQNAVRAVHRKLSKTLNRNSSEREYANLVPLAAATTEPVASAQLPSANATAEDTSSRFMRASTKNAAVPTRIPRAKLSVDENWKITNEATRPPPLLLESERELLERDIVTISFPQSTYTMGEAGSASRNNNPYSGIRPVLSISSLALNFEDSNCLKFFEKPFDTKDFL
ncbi:hypothetical protein BC830DRAFT_1107846 [Chytriomyces sp. MP71]|nr:hypothetical protein BC830DRAFT_1107846 [Chytriomyces sp. MP71]